MIRAGTSRLRAQRASGAVGQRLPGGSLLLHGGTQGQVLVGGHHLVDLDSGGGQDALEVGEGLLGHGRLPAQDPGELGAHGTELAAAEHQGVAGVVGGQHPVVARGRAWRRGGRHYNQTSTKTALA